MLFDISFLGRFFDQPYRDFVKVDERFQRPAEVDLLIGDASKARKELGWSARYSFTELVKEMVRSDLELASGQPLGLAGRHLE